MTTYNYFNNSISEIKEINNQKSNTNKENLDFNNIEYNLEFYGTPI